MSDAVKHGLLPCPFCRGPAQVHFIPLEWGEPGQANTEMARIACKDPMCITQGCHRPITAAVKKWNQRSLKIERNALESAIDFLDELQRPDDSEVRA